MELATLLVAFALAALHLVAGKLRFLDGTPRSIWLSGAGGVSVAYVFVHVLPDLADAQAKFQAVREGWLGRFELHVWILALLGLAVFYGIERFVRHDQQRNKRATGSSGAPNTTTTSAGVFWIHTASFAAYNLLFGYLLLHRETPGLRSLIIYGTAIGLHFLVTDYGLRQDHRDDYHRIVRWVLAASMLVGWALGRFVNIHELGTSALFAFLAGGIILNVMKEELPEERESRFSAFALGMAGYAAILLAV